MTSEPVRQLRTAHVELLEKMYGNTPTKWTPEPQLKLLEALRARHPLVETGRFGAHMQVHLVNDGPVTFWLQA